MPKKPYTLPGETDDDEADGEDTPESFAAYRHKLFTGLYFWTVCPRAICKRGRQCLGDVHLCGRRHLPLVPARTKALLYKIVQARSAGLSPEEAERVAEEDMKRHDAMDLGER